MASTRLRVTRTLMAATVVAISCSVIDAGAASAASVTYYCQTFTDREGLGSGTSCTGSGAGPGTIYGGNGVTGACSYIFPHKNGTVTDVTGINCPLTAFGRLSSWSGASDGNHWGAALVTARHQGSPWQTGHSLDAATSGRAS